MFDHSPCNILLIEDNAMDVDLIQHALQKTAASVLFSIARDGEAALAFIKRWEAGAPTPVLILLDLKLPKVSGFDVLKSFKSHPRYRALPVVVLTSSSDPGDIQSSYVLGANSYIQKVTDYDQFAKSIQLTQRYWCRLNIQPE
jgi:CheY-like chemotaxis protein